MSRLEEALEKAVRLRDQQGMDAPTVKPLKVNSPVPPPQPEGIELNNQLLVAANAPNTPIAEEYRKLKSAIVQLTKGDEFKNMLMVTSALSNEGKSLTAINLAMTLAQEHDNTVLLVDADLRKPSLHKYLQIDATRGLTECLVDGVDMKEVLVKTGFGRLTFLPAGREVKSPAEVFSSQKTKAFFSSMKSRYRDRYVIIDTPPMLPFAETRFMSSMVDGTILVVKEGSTKAKLLTETLECIKDNTKLLGIVYNAVTQQHTFKENHYYRSDG